MSVEEKDYRLDKGMPVFIDIDKTLLKGDTGREWLAEAGVVSHEEFPEFIEQYSRGDLGHSNELLEFLSRNPGKLDELDPYIDSIWLDERSGLSEILDHRFRERVPTVGASAGYRPVIQEATNGNLDDIIAGDLDEDYEPEFNGQKEKRENVENYLESLVQQTKWWAENDLPYTAVGDSNGDLEKLRGASDSGGYAIAIGDSLEEVEQRVNEATFYVADEEEHYLTAALLNELTLHENYSMSTEQLLEKTSDIHNDQYGIKAGELADNQDRKELRDFKERLGYE